MKTYRTQLGKWKGIGQRGLAPAGDYKDHNNDAIVLI
jgi:hypothetical protein